MVNSVRVKVRRASDFHAHSGDFSLVFSRFIRLKNPVKYKPIFESNPPILGIPPPTLRRIDKTAYTSTRYTLTPSQGASTVSQFEIEKPPSAPRKGTRKAAQNAKFGIATAPKAQAKPAPAVQNIGACAYPR